MREGKIEEGEVGVAPLEARGLQKRQCRDPYPMVGRTGGRTNPRRPKNNTPICMIDFDQAVVQFPCKFLVASIVLGCNKKIITKEKVDFR